MEVHCGVEGHVAVEEGLSQEGDEVAAHSEQDVGEHEGDAGGRASRQDDAHKGGLCNPRGWRGKAVVWRQSGTLKSRNSNRKALHMSLPTAPNLELIQ